MKRLSSSIKLSIFSVLVASLSACNSDSEVMSFNDRTVNFSKDWQFHLNAETEGDTISETTTWRNLNVPHDWSVELPFNEHSAAGIGGGALDGGLGWYKKTFTVDSNDTDKIVSLVFDGVYMNSDVFINGHHLGMHPNGYIGFEYNLTPYLNYGNTKNEVLVKVDNSNQPNSRWYSGSGIYRNVWLKTTNKVHVATWGTFVTTPKVSTDNATVNVKVKVINELNEAKNITVKNSIWFRDHKVASIEDTQVSIEATNSNESSYAIVVPNPELWTVDTPEMYTLVTQLETDGNIIDEYKTPFGIRSFYFDLDKGFILNDKQIKIKGVCMHHDLGPLGAAVNTRALERQLEILKEMGVNGIRTSHNPPTPELLDLCDTMGFIVMDEAFDMWEKNKTEFDYANYWDDWHKKDLEDQIYRDRNHPSVFMWSIGNEIPEQWSERGAEIGRELSQIVKALDTTRYVTAAMNPPVSVTNESVTIQFQNTADRPNDLAASGALDIIGYNYAHQTYEKHKVNFPNTPFIATETTSTLQTRGHYDFPSDTTKIWPVRWDLKFTGGNPGNTVSAFDQTRAPWGSLHETTWKIIKRNEYLSGFYIWTGFDYIGEPTPYEWPSRSSYFGIVDLAGFPKDIFYMYQGEWTDKDVLHIFPHWNWEEGQVVDVWAYYNHADEVELFLNGKSMGVKRKEGEDLHVMWRFPFEPGTLKAVSRKDGKVILEKMIQTAGDPAKLALTADRETIHADGNDLSFITVDIKDAKDIFAATANNQIDFEVKGEGKIIGVSSGDPTNHESFKGNTHKALNGKCLVIIQSTDKAGTIEVTAKSNGLESATITLTSN